MGRGRQKAKHTKVARELKYFSPDTNYGALEKELGKAEPMSAATGDFPEPDYSDYEDPYADQFDDEDDDEDESAAQQSKSA
jgi:hypothetical protein